MVKILPITKVREDLPNLVDRASRLLEEYIITVNGEPKAILMSHDEFESWKETMDILSDPKTIKSIRKGEEDLKKGRYVTLEQLEQELGLDV